MCVGQIRRYGLQKLSEKMRMASSKVLLNHVAHVTSSKITDFRHNDAPDDVIKTTEIAGKEIWITYRGHLSGSSLFMGF